MAVEYLVHILQGPFDLPLHVATNPDSELGRLLDSPDHGLFLQAGILARILAEDPVELLAGGHCKNYCNNSKHDVGHHIPGDQQSGEAYLKHRVKLVH